MAQPERELCSSHSTLQHLAEIFAGLQPLVIDPAAPAETLLPVLTFRAVDAVPAAEHVAVTRGEQGLFRTVAATSDYPLKVDAIQYELGAGPCVDAIRKETVYVTGDIASDERWPDFGRRAAAEAGLASMMSFRMFLEASDEQIAGLNFYSTRLDAFTGRDRTVGLLLSTHGALAVAAMQRGQRASQLAAALASNREIGVAMGVLMASRKITRRQAFDLLRIASQHSHRKLAAIAIDVAESGTLDLPLRD